MPSVFLDRDVPPFFRSFLIVSVTPERLRIRAFGVEDFDQASLESEPIWDQAVPLTQSS